MFTAYPSVLTVTQLLYALDASKSGTGLTYPFFEIRFTGSFTMGVGRSASISRGFSASRVASSAH